MPTPVEGLYGEFVALAALLEQGREVSLRVTADSIFRKALLLSAASFFEHRLVNELLGFVSERSQGDELIDAFVRNKALKRQYHTLFDWDGRSANQFFRFFGAGFLGFMRAEIAGNQELKASVDAFLELGDERNRLVHTDFATFQMEKTTAEIFDLFRKATHFVDRLGTKLREYRAEQAEAGGGDRSNRGAYIPGAIEGIGQRPFRYPPS